MIFPESLFNTFNAPDGLTVKVQKFRPVGQERKEWVVACIFTLANGIETFEQVSIPFSEMSRSADQDEVGIEAWRRMGNRVIEWVDRNKDAESLEGKTYSA